MDQERLNRITVEEGKCGGRPCIRGQRIRVTDVLELLAAGASYDEILRDYAFLEREDILAALDYAAHQTDHVVIRASWSLWLITNVGAGAAYLRMGDLDRKEVPANKTQGVG